MCVRSALCDRPAAARVLSIAPNCLPKMHLIMVTVVPVKTTLLTCGLSSENGFAASKERNMAFTIEQLLWELEVISVTQHSEKAQEE